MHLTKSRLEGLTDGIFAFAMTLLVIGLNLPDKASVVQTQAFATGLLLSLYSGFYHYVLAFLILGGFWLMHHVELHPVKALDRVFVWLNLVTLMFVALLPFSTSFSGDFPGISFGSMIFELNLFAIGFGMCLQWKYATSGDRLVEPGLAPVYVRHITARTLIVPLISCMGILIALTGNLYSSMVYLLIPVIQVIIRYHMKREKRHAPESTV